MPGADFGDPKSYQGIYAKQPFREARMDELGRMNSATGVRGVIDPMDPLNPYRPKSKKDVPAKTLKKLQSLSKSTAAAGSDESCLYQKSSEPLGAMSSVFSQKKGSTINHLEIPPNFDKKLFDEAVAVIKGICEKIDLSNVQSLKYHINTWGLSSNNWFADNMVHKMKRLNAIDFSDTVNYQHRSDMCMGIKAILSACAELPI